MCLLSCFLGNTLLAQNSATMMDIISVPSFFEEKEGLIGWEVGANRSVLKNYWKNKFEVSYKFKAGLSTIYFFTKKWGIQGDLVYEEKGGYSDGLEVNYKLHYLNLSACPRFRIKKLYGFSGFYIGYLLKAKDDIPQNTIVPGALEAKKFNKIDFGWKSGVGVNVFKTIDLEFGFDSGLASVYDYPLTGASGHPSSETIWYRTKTMYLSLKFYLKSIQLN